MVNGLCDPPPCVCVCARAHARTHARTHAHAHTHTHTHNEKSREQPSSPTVLVSRAYIDAYGLFTKSIEMTLIPAHPIRRRCPFTVLEGYFIFIQGKHCEWPPWQNYTSGDKSDLGYGYK